MEPAIERYTNIFYLYHSTKSKIKREAIKAIRNTPNFRLDIEQVFKYNGI